MKFNAPSAPPEELVKIIASENPMDPRKVRAPKGYWDEPALVVKGLVNAGYPVSHAVRLTLEKLKLPAHTRLQSGLRAAYYNNLKAVKSSRK